MEKKLERFATRLMILVGFIFTWVVPAQGVAISDLDIVCILTTLIVLIALPFVVWIVEH